MSLSKALNPSTAPVNQQQDKWLLLGSSLRELVCNCVNVKQRPLPAKIEVSKRSKDREKKIMSETKGEEVRDESRR